MLIGDDITVLIHDETGAGLLALGVILRRDEAGRLVAEEAAEQVICIFGI
jgi:hypothetical protein